MDSKQVSSDMPMHLRDIPMAKRMIRHVEKDLARLRNPQAHIEEREGELKMLKDHLAELKLLGLKETD